MRKKNRFFASALCVSMATAFVACDKNDDPILDPTLPVVPTQTLGAYILNQGKYQSSNTSISYYDLAKQKLTTRMFEAANGRKLGDTGQHMLIYGSKLYISVYGSNTIEVVDKTTLKSIATLSPRKEGQPQSPRCLAAGGEYVYVSLFDGNVSRIDTATLTFDKSVAVGLNPEQMAVANNQLYVCNSGGMNFPDCDTTVSVVDLIKLTVRATIPVVINPTEIVADSQGDVYVISMGTYGGIPNSLQRIPTGQTKKSDVILNASHMTMHNDTLYAIYAPWGEPSGTYQYIQYDAVKEQVINNMFITDGTLITAPNSISVDPSTGNIYIGDALDFKTNGDMYIFSPQGKKIAKFETGGLTPATTLFLTNQ